MSNKDEKLSALLDNALDRKELDAFVGDLMRDPLDDAERIQRYRIIGDAMRDELSEISLLDISAAVHREVSQQEALNVKPARRRARWFGTPALIRPLTGMAIAASVAMVTVVAVRTVNTETAGEQVPAMASANPSSAADHSAPVNPVNPAIAQHVRAASADAGEQARLRNEQLSEYMMNHSGYAGQNTVQGMMPYARVVGFDAEPEH